MSTRELRVKFVGDAGNLKSTFSQVGAEAATAGTGFRQAGLGADDAGQALTRTGRGLRGFGRAFKGAGLDAAGAGASFASSIPALSGVASGLGIATVAGDALVSTLGAVSPIGLVAVAGAAIAAGAGSFVIMNGNASYGAEALAKVASSADEAARAQSRAASASTRLSEALRGVTDNAREQQHAAFDVADAEKAYADAVKKSGASSREAREASLELADAEARQAEVRRAGVRAGRDAIQQTERSSRAAENAVKQAKEHAAAQKRVADGVAFGVLVGAKYAGATDKLAAAQKRVAAASRGAEVRHRANAERARDAASAIQGAGTAANTLRSRLRNLARQELNMANAISEMERLRGVSSDAAAALGSVKATMEALDGLNIRANATIFRRVITTGPGAKLGLQEVGGGRRSAIERGAFLRGVAGGSALGLERTTARGERAAQTAQMAAEDKARKAGKTEDQIRIEGERAYANRRLRTIRTLRSKMKSRYQRQVRTLQALRKALRATKVPAGGDDKKNAARQKALEKRERLRQQINAILDELETLAANDADLVVEAARLGEDLEALKRDEAAAESEAAEEAASAAAEAAANAPTAADFAEAAVAEAALTPGAEDDIAAADQLVRVREAELAAARATGDPRLVAAAAQAVAAARQARAQLDATDANTDALNANTEAITRSFGGSNVIGYRGQDWVLGRLSPPSSDRLTGMEVGL